MIGRIYYLSEDGQIIYNTCALVDDGGYIEQTTVEQDMQSWSIQRFNPEHVRYIEMESDEFFAAIEGAASYRINPDTEALEVTSFYDPNTPPLDYSPPLSQRVEELETENATLRQRLAATEQLTAETSELTQFMLESMIERGMI